MYVCMYVCMYIFHVMCECIFVGMYVMLCYVHTQKIHTYIHTYIHTIHTVRILSLFCSVRESWMNMKSKFDNKTFSSSKSSRLLPCSNEREDDC